MNALLDTASLELGNSLPLSWLASLSHNVELGLVVRAFSIDDIFRCHPQELCTCYCTRKYASQVKNDSWGELTIYTIHTPCN